MICVWSRCFSWIYSVNDDDMNFVLGPGFFSFVAGGSVSSMHGFFVVRCTLYYIGLPHRMLVLKSCHNRVYFACLNNNAL